MTHRRTVAAKKNFRRSNPPNPPKRRESGEYTRFILILFVAFALLGGFALSARKHFAALEYSFRNVRLKKEIERLKNEQRELLLKRESVLSPAELEKKAHKLGLQRLSGSQISVNSADVAVKHF